MNILAKKIIAIYGKGGIGKSSTASNVAAACAEAGYSVMIIGCDPKSDSSITLLGGRRIPTVLDQLRNLKDIKKEDIIFEGYGGVKCVEVGGPEPGVGCAGRGIIVAIEQLKKVYPEFMDNDLIIYDVPGDVVCGGFVAPIKKGFVSEIYVLTSGEYMPLYAANNICRGFSRIGMSVGGVICNSRNAEHEKELAEEFAKGIGTRLIGYIPKDPVVQNCERDGFSVLEKAPDTAIADTYRALAAELMANTDLVTAEPMDDETLRELSKKYNRSFRTVPFQPPPLMHPVSSGHFCSAPGNIRTGTATGSDEPAYAKIEIEICNHVAVIGSQILRSFPMVRFPVMEDAPMQKNSMSNVMIQTKIRPERGDHHAV